MNIKLLTIALYLTIISVSNEYIEKFGVDSFSKILISEPSGIFLLFITFLSISYIGYYKFLR